MFSENDIRWAELRRVQALQSASRLRTAAELREIPTRRTMVKRVSGWLGQRLVALGTRLQDHAEEWDVCPRPLYNGVEPTIG